jgi:hypothetical protein
LTFYETINVKDYFTPLSTDRYPIGVWILKQLFYTRTVSIGWISERSNISCQAASTLVSQSEKANILRETTRWKRDKHYFYRDYMDILAEGTQILEVLPGQKVE